MMTNGHTFHRIALCIINFARQTCAARLHHQGDHTAEGGNLAIVTMSSLENAGASYYSGVYYPYYTSPVAGNSAFGASADYLRSMIDVEHMTVFVILVERMVGRCAAFGAYHQLLWRTLGHHCYFGRRGGQQLSAR